MMLNIGPCFLVDILIKIIFLYKMSVQYYEKHIDLVVNDHTTGLTQSVQMEPNGPVRVHLVPCVHSQSYGGPCK